MITSVAGTEALNRKVVFVGDVSLITAPYVVISVAVTAKSWLATRTRLTAGAHHRRRAANTVSALYTLHDRHLLPS